MSSNLAMAEDSEMEFTKLLDKPKLHIERQRSLDELSVANGTLRAVDSYESMYPPSAARRSAPGTPMSPAPNAFEPHFMVADAWDALRRSLVFFRGQPVGTLAAYDHASEEALNYDQVLITTPLKCLMNCLAIMQLLLLDIVKEWILMRIL